MSTSTNNRQLTSSWYNRDTRLPSLFHQAVVTCYQELAAESIGVLPFISILWSPQSDYRLQALLTSKPIDDERRRFLLFFISVSSSSGGHDRASSGPSVNESRQPFHGYVSWRTYNGLFAFSWNAIHQSSTHHGMEWRLMLSVTDLLSWLPACWLTDWPAVATKRPQSSRHSFIQEGAVSYSELQPWKVDP